MSIHILNRPRCRAGTRRAFFFEHVGGGAFDDADLGELAADEANDEPILISLKRGIIRL